MGVNGGMANLQIAVPSFIDHFDDGLDRASMISFGCAARVDVPMTQPFRAAIKSNLNAFFADGWTASEAGLEKARQQNRNVSINPEERVLKVIVFVTDGLANTFPVLWQLRCAESWPKRPIQRQWSTGTFILNPTNGARGFCSATTSHSIGGNLGGALYSAGTLTISGNNQNVWREGQLRALATAQRGSQCR